MEGKRAPATTSHSRSWNESQDLGTIHVRMKHNKRNRNGTRKRPPLSNPWLKTRLLLCRISVHFLFLTPTVPHILSLHRTTDIKVCTACSYEQCQSNPYECTKIKECFCLKHFKELFCAQVLNIFRLSFLR